jgi:DNA mismatch repair protein MutS
VYFVQKKVVGVFVRFSCAASGKCHSFGIHVAKMAGMPQIVILKAQKILKKLEKNHSSDMLNGIKSEKMKCK